MKLSQTRQAIIEQLLQLKPISSHKQYEVILNAAFYDYTENIVRMVEGMSVKAKSKPSWTGGVDDAIDILLEELNK